ncbi:hypothetical protein DASC09_018890 [Saccharomycopsis crataegensis]|uniref:Uncharacterized protein n=1 Tax=Saccharomycopsis crataegensis TaxID=43959 RepID=A0AAV5QIV9_9ASCO|nr:hypothetical protein DASC09_018890 [Saccharomycopsis crataegensis]
MKFFQLKKHSAPPATSQLRNGSSLPPIDQYTPRGSSILPSYAIEEDDLEEDDDETRANTMRNSFLAQNQNFTLRNKNSRHSFTTNYNNSRDIGYKRGTNANANAAAAAALSRSNSLRSVSASQRPRPSQPRLNSLTNRASSSQKRESQGARTLSLSRIDEQPLSRSNSHRHRINNRDINNTPQPIRNQEKYSHFTSPPNKKFNEGLSQRRSNSLLSNTGRTSSFSSLPPISNRRYSMASMLTNNSLDMNDITIQSTTTKRGNSVVKQTKLIDSQGVTRRIITKTIKKIGAYEVVKSNIINLSNDDPNSSILENGGYSDIDELGDLEELDDNYEDVFLPQDEKFVTALDLNRHFEDFDDALAPDDDEPQYANSINRDTRVDIERASRGVTGNGQLNGEEKTESQIKDVSKEFKTLGMSDKNVIKKSDNTTVSAPLTKPISQPTDNESQYSDAMSHTRSSSDVKLPFIASKTDDIEISPFQSPSKQGRSSQNITQKNKSSILRRSPSEEFDILSTRSMRSNRSRVSFRGVDIINADDGQRTASRSSKKLSEKEMYDAALNAATAKIYGSPDHANSKSSFERNLNQENHVRSDRRYSMRSENRSNYNPPKLRKKLSISDSLKSISLNSKSAFQRTEPKHKKPTGVVPTSPSVNSISANNGTLRNSEKKKKLSRKEKRYLKEKVKLENMDLSAEIRAAQNSYNKKHKDDPYVTPEALDQTQLIREETPEALNNTNIENSSLVDSTGNDPNKVGEQVKKKRKFNLLKLKWN